MNILDLQEQPEDSFENEDSQHFSIQQETQELLHEVFDQKYEPVYNPDSTKLKEYQYKKSRKRAKQLAYPERTRTSIRKPDKNHKVYQYLDDEDLSPSFKQFLARAQERLERKDRWVGKQIQKKEKVLANTLKQIPQILRGSREKVMPIYQRCIELQKSKQKNLQVKRIEKYRKEVQKAQSFTYHPKINDNQKKRSFQQYIAEKEIWQQQKIQQLQKKRVANEVKKLSQCTFAPMLVAKYNKKNPRIIPGEKVEERLLRSIQKSKEKQNVELSEIRYRYEL